MRLVIDCPLSTTEDAELRAWINGHNGFVDEVSVHVHTVVVRDAASKTSQMAFRQNRSLVEALDQAYRDLF
jgi:hypothetical protein